MQSIYTLSTEPKESPRPQPIGNAPFIILFTTCTLCFIFILWRRADALRRVVAHRYVLRRYSLIIAEDISSLSLKTFRQNEGAIRLSQDEGPPANEFLADDYDDDNEHLHDSDDEPLSEHIRRTTLAWREPSPIPQTQGNGHIRVPPPNLPAWPSS